MTDRFNALIVVLERNNRDDDSQPLMDAIKLFEGVADVTGHVATTSDAIAQSRVRRELGEKLFKVIYPND